MTVVVDASVAIKWVLEEDGTPAARQLIADELVIAPDFMTIECANVLWRRFRLRQLSSDAAKAALRAIQAVPLQLFPSSDHAAAAQSLALDLDRTVYDCLYLAVAVAENAVLVTADRSFVQGVTQHGAHSAAVRLLA